MHLPGGQELTFLLGGEGAVLNLGGLGTFYIVNRRTTKKGVSIWGNNKVHPASKIFIVRSCKFKCSLEQTKK